MKFIDAPVLAQQIIIILSILALVFSIIDIFITLRICKKRWFKILTIISFLSSFIFIFLTMRGSYLYRVKQSVFYLSLKIIQEPFWLISSLSIMLLLLSIILLIYAFKWGNQAISSISIKESVETLLKGICFYEKSGLIHLFNEEMNRLCIILCGNALLNGSTFWNNIITGKLNEGFYLIQNKNDEAIINFLNIEFFSFKRIKHNIDEKEIYEIIATNITEEYKLTKELEIQLQKLKLINQRLLSYGQNIAILTREKEILSAKIRIHDDIGKLLLITKRKLSSHLNNDEQNKLLSFWKNELEALTTIQKDEKRSNLQVIFDAARLIDIKIDFLGDYPPENSLLEKILIHAMHECLTNTVSHANGHLLNVNVKDNLIKITNDGTPPKGIIKEGGGLSSLRSLIEKENGKMIVNSEPQFELIIDLRGEKK